MGFTFYGVFCLLLVVASIGGVFSNSHVLLQIKKKTILLIYFATPQI